MNRHASCFAAVFLFALLFLGAVEPTQAALTSDDVTAELLKARDESSASLAAGLAALKTKTDEKFSEIKDELGKEWVKDLATTLAAVAGKLDAQRLKIIEGLAGDPERLDRVSTATTAQFASLTKKLADLKDGVGQRLTNAGYDPGKPGVTEADLKKIVLGDEGTLAKLTKEMTAVLGEATWSGVISSIASAHAAPTAQQQVQKAVDSATNFIKSLEDDFERQVTCTYDYGSASLSCGKAISVNGVEISEIKVVGLPSDKKATVTVNAAKDAAQEDQCWDPEVDSGTFEKDLVPINVYLERWIAPTYGGWNGYTLSLRNGKLDKVLQRLRYAPFDKRTQITNDKKSPLAETQECDCRCQQQIERRQLAIIVSGAAPAITVSVTIDNRTASDSIEVGYARWGIDSGGFFAISWLADEKLTTEPKGTDGKMVTVKSVRGASNLSQDTGVFLNLVPKNYPFLGIGIGFSTNNDNANTFYFGPSVRLLSYRNRGIASFSAGATMRSVTRFPGLKENADLSASDPRLQGEKKFKVAPYVILQLGFAFGRVPGPDDGSNN